MSSVLLYQEEDDLPVGYLHDYKSADHVYDFDTSDEYGDKIMHSLIPEIPKDSLDLITWSPEAVVDALLNIWQNYGGDSHLKLYRKSSYRKKLRREMRFKS